jgi:hypothetical protein
MSIGVAAAPSLNAWRPMELQVVVFPVGPSGLPEEQWWREVAGQEPDESIRRRGERAYTGQLPDATLSLSVDPIKIAWAMRPRLDPENPPLSIPTLSAFPATRDRFIGLMTRWITDLCPPVKRMGFAGSMIQGAESHADAYRLLSRYLPSVEVDPESYDFLYRVNRKTQSNTAVPNLGINRLSMWSATRAVFFFQHITSGTETPATLTHLREPQFAVKVDLDINSDAERADSLPTENRLDLLNELAAFATQIAANGDRR